MNKQLKLSAIFFLIFNILNLTNLQSGYAQWISGVLHAFDGTDGAISKGSLTLVGNTLYGRTSAGGANGKGVIFKINNDSTGFQVLYNFLDGSSNGFGKEPHHDAMLFADSILYGTALLGGSNDNGVIYQINLSGGGYDTLHVFRGGNNDGAQPHSGLILLGDVFYGITAAGGTHNNGTIYRINADGSGFAVIYSFHNSTGDDSHGRLTLSKDSTKLLGMTKGGGSSSLGVIFSFKLSDSSYTVLHTFQGGNNDGSTTDHGFLTRCNDTVFGMTQYGGTADKGVVFSMKDGGSDFQVLHSFGSSSNDGTHPFGSLQLSNGYLYGTTREGGEHDHGTVFRITIDGTIYETIYSLKLSTSGEYPIDNVVLNNGGNEIYCLSQAGGENDSTGSNQYGTIFELNTLGSMGIQNISSSIPDEFHLYQNYPNPFNPETKIKFEISKSSFVRLIVYNSVGQKIATLVNENLNAGQYDVNWIAADFPSGVYYYKFEANEYSDVKKLLLIK